MIRWSHFILVVIFSGFTTIRSIISSNLEGVPVFRDVKFVIQVLLSWIIKSCICILIYCALHSIIILEPLGKYEFIPKVILACIFPNLSFYIILGVFGKLFESNIKAKSSKTHKIGKIASLSQEVKKIIVFDEDAILETKERVLREIFIYDIYNNKQTINALNKLFEFWKEEINEYQKEKNNNLSSAYSNWVLKVKLFSRKFYLLIDFLGWKRTIELIQDPNTINLVPPAME